MQGKVSMLEGEPLLAPQGLPSSRTTLEEMGASSCAQAHPTPAARPSARPPARPLKQGQWPPTLPNPTPLSAPAARLLPAPPMGLCI